MGTNIIEGFQIRLLMANLETKGRATSSGTRDVLESLRYGNFPVAEFSEPYRLAVERQIGKIMTAGPMMIGLAISRMKIQVLENEAYWPCVSRFYQLSADGRGDSAALLCLLLIVRKNK